MQHLRIIRQGNKILLSDEELEADYRIMERRYLEEDLTNYLIDDHDRDCISLHYHHLEEFPEILDWLCDRFDDFCDANLSHNDMIELLMNHLFHALQTPEFFKALAENAKPVCLGESMEVKICEENCDLFNQCPTLKLSVGRARQFEALSVLLTMHKHDNCSCKKSKKDPKLCSAAKYLQGTWDIKEFYCSQSRRRKEAA